MLLCCIFYHPICKCLMFHKYIILVFNSPDTIFINLKKIENLNNIRCSDWYRRLEAITNITFDQYMLLNVTSLILRTLFSVASEDNSGLHLTSIHRCGGESCLAHHYSWPYQVSRSGYVLTGHQLEFLPGQYCFITGCITQRGEELKLSMTTPKEKTYPGITNVRLGVFLFLSLNITTYQ